MWLLREQWYSLWWLQLNVTYHNITLLRNNCWIKNFKTSFCLKAMKLNYFLSRISDVTKWLQCNRAIFICIWLASVVHFQLNFGNDPAGELCVRNERNVSNISETFNGLYRCWFPVYPWYQKLAGWISLIQKMFSITKKTFAFLMILFISKII